MVFIRVKWILNNSHITIRYCKMVIDIRFSMTIFLLFIIEYQEDAGRVLYLFIFNVVTVFYYKNIINFDIMGLHLSLVNPSNNNRSLEKERYQNSLQSFCMQRKSKSFSI